MLAFLTPLKGGPATKTRVFKRYNRRKSVNQKILTSVSHIISSVQVSTNIFIATQGCRVGGIRWSLSCASQQSGNGEYAWAIVYVPEGRNPLTLEIGTPSSANTARQLYMAADNVLACGLLLIDNVLMGARTEGSSKAVRRMHEGDRIVLIMRRVDGVSIVASGAVQIIVMQ